VSPWHIPETIFLITKAIEDNSFYIEEAVNQEKGVVQHISTLNAFSSTSREMVFGFTQEWPIGSLLHHLSLSMSYMSADGDMSTGFGDFPLNNQPQRQHNHIDSGLADFFWRRS
jgi:hypothetical protein